MATPLSFRDRFFSPPVARAVTSPSAILALGAGAALGIVATAPVSVPLAVVGALLGGVVGYGGRVALAIPRSAEPAERIDPFGVNEPWRRAVIDAVRARARYEDALKDFRRGPLHDSVLEIGSRLDEAVQECWKIANQGQAVANARGRIDDREVRWELKKVAEQIPAGGEATPTQTRTVASLNSQLATAERMDALFKSTMDELDLLNARMDESVTQAIELSVSNQAGGLDPLGADVEEIVDDLQSLRLAMGDLDQQAAGNRDVPAPPPLPSAATTALPPPPPPPVTRTDPAPGP